MPRARRGRRRVPTRPDERRPWGATEARIACAMGYDTWRAWRQLSHPSRAADAESGNRQVDEKSPRRFPEASRAQPHFAPPSAVHESSLDVVPAPRVRSNAR